MRGLGVVGNECIKFVLNELGDVFVVVHFGCAHYPDFSNTPCLKAFVVEQARVGKGVSGIGVDRENCGFTGGEVVRVR